MEGVGPGTMLLPDPRLVDIAELVPFSGWFKGNPGVNPQFGLSLTHSHLTFLGFLRCFSNKQQVSLLPRV